MQNNIKVLVVFGTRPEAIKMIPVAQQLAYDNAFESKICVTGQHREMLDQVLSLFKIQPDFDLDIMTAGQDLTDITTRILQAFKLLFQQYRPDIVLVHGDTTTTFATALACYYHQIPVGHIEAGLRTQNLFSPFPEEGNRCLTSVIADYHFCPTLCAKQNLLQENQAEDRIWVVGNTVEETLSKTLEQLEQNPKLTAELASRYTFLDSNKKLILVTAHRRESFGTGVEQICQALAEIANSYSDLQIIYPVHRNPEIYRAVHQRLAQIHNVFLLEPQDYLPFVYLMNCAHLILTDSGSIQEEAPFLGKPVLVMRENTERVEALDSGALKLVGTSASSIVMAVRQLLDDERIYQQMAHATNPYSSQGASKKIVAILKQIFGKQ